MVKQDSCWQVGGCFCDPSFNIVCLSSGLTRAGSILPASALTCIFGTRCSIRHSAGLACEFAGSFPSRTAVCSQVCNCFTHHTVVMRYPWGKRQQQTQRADTLYSYLFSSLSPHPLRAVVLPVCPSLLCIHHIRCPHPTSLGFLCLALACYSILLNKQHELIPSSDAYVISHTLPVI